MVLLCWTAPAKRAGCMLFVQLCWISIWLMIIMQWLCYGTRNSTNPTLVVPLTVYLTVNGVLYCFGFVFVTYSYTANVQVELRIAGIQLGAQPPKTLLHLCHNLVLKLLLICEGVSVQVTCPPFSFNCLWQFCLVTIGLWHNHIIWSVWHKNFNWLCEGGGEEEGSEGMVTYRFIHEHSNYGCQWACRRWRVAFRMIWPWFYRWTFCSCL